MCALTETAVRAAERGVLWTAIAVDLTRSAEALLRAHNGPMPFLPGNRLPRAGDRLQLSGLAKLLGHFSHLGAELFFGAIGEVVARRVGGAGGFLWPEDLRHRPARWTPPEQLRFSG